MKWGVESYNQASCVQLLFKKGLFCLYTTHQRPCVLERKTSKVVEFVLSSSLEQKTQPQRKGKKFQLAKALLNTWLILPVVIRLSQRLSHACLSLSALNSETADGSLNQK
jgi:hypothetical protein